MDQKRAITETGRQVLLNKDGEWSYRAEDELAPEAPDFRKCRWGMSTSEVKKRETLDLIKDSEEGLVYRGEVSHRPCLVAYIFTMDQLIRAKYSFVSEHASPNDYVDDFEQLRDILNRKYGEAAESRVHWVDDRYRDERECWGKAVALGHLLLWEVWETQSTEISLMLRGADQGPALEIEYSSKQLDRLDDVPETNELDEF